VEFDKEPREVLAMPTAVYSEWAGTRTPNEAPGAVAWVLLVALVVMSALGGWAVSAAIQRRWRLEQGEQGPAVDQPWRMGEPGLAPPSTSAEALAEVAQLEELWRLPAKRAITGMD
jgi:hypothetical protein